MKQNIYDFIFVMIIVVYYVNEFMLIYEYLLYFNFMFFKLYLKVNWLGRLNLVQMYVENIGYIFLYRIFDV